MNLNAKDELVRRLLIADGEPISGQEIADEFSLSRTAIWKYVKELELEGYEISSVRKKGYILTKSPDLLNAANIQTHLTTETIGRSIQHFLTLPSTQLVAHDEAQNGVMSGTVVIAEEQTAGRGRMARQWSSVAGKGIWMSVIIRPTLTPQQAPQMTLVAAVAVTRAIQEITGLEPDIKWPNDILINGKKVTGILTELQTDPDRVKSVILGIGMNVNQDEVDFPEDIIEIATSLKICTGVTIDRAKLVAKVFSFLELYTKMYEKHGFAPIKILWEGFANTTGKRIRAVMLNETIVGKALGISDEGVLEVLLDDGSVRGIYSADINIQ